MGRHRGTRAPVRYGAGEVLIAVGIGFLAAGLVLGVMAALGI